MNLFWIVMLTFISVGTGTGLSFWLLHKAHEVNASVWILEHVVCPIIRILVLLFIVSLIYPAIDTQSSSLEFWKVLGRQGQFNDLLNVLFFAGLLLAFIPVVNHPVFALPIQSILTIALVFSWQYYHQVDSMQLLPDTIVLLKLVAYMLLAYFVTRQSSLYLSHRLDRKFNIEGSIHLVSDAIYLTLQIPVMLMYSSFLKLQLEG